MQTENCRACSLQVVDCLPPEGGVDCTPPLSGRQSLSLIWWPRLHEIFMTSHSVGVPL